MKLSSTAFDHNSQIPKIYTCYGKNILPPLSFRDVPDKAETLLLVVKDLETDNKILYNLIAWNIPATITKIEKGGEIPGVIGQNSYGHHTWNGPCPDPDNDTHRYSFKLYALDMVLDQTINSTYGELINAIQDDIIDEDEIVGVYQKNH